MKSDVKYSRGDKHPTDSKLFFFEYRKGKEIWKDIEFINNVRERARIWRSKNKDSSNKKAKEARLKNPDKFKQYARSFYARNKDRLLQEQKERRIKDWDHVRSVERKSRLKHSHKDTERESRRRAQKVMLTVDGYESMINQFYEARKRISNCIGMVFHVDHVIPLSSGGLHAPWNLQIVPAIWNLRKNNRNSDRFKYNTITEKN